MNSIKIELFRVLRKLLTRNIFKVCSDYVELSDQEANDYIYSILELGKPCMIAKFGTVELDAILAYYFEDNGITPSVYCEAIRRKACIYPETQLWTLCNNAGFFPNDKEKGRLFYHRMIKDIREVDVLASYIQGEKYLLKYMSCKKVNLNGFYAPFMWDKPWTRVLKGKKVLIIHPFVETIKRQYENYRSFLFEDAEVLPEFKSLDYIKAVQSIAGEQVPFKDWFEALKYMEDEISKKDFDIAIIGCGAYGFCLAAHVKRIGKQAVHLAGWTQILFGIYGNRWVKDEPGFHRYINKYWTRPSDRERPKTASKVEGACYW